MASMFSNKRNDKSYSTIHERSRRGTGELAQILSGVVLVFHTPDQAAAVRPGLALPSNEDVPWPVDHFILLTRGISALGGLPVSAPFSRGADALRPLA